MIPDKRKVVPLEAEAGAPALLCARGVSKSFVSQNGRQVAALRDVNLSVRKHEFVAIVGPSGCGKSTLLNILAGLYEPDGGQVLCDGRPVKEANMESGHISQADTLLPWRTVMGNVELGLEIKGVRKQDRRRIAARLIERVGLGDFAKSYPFELSGGMRKRAIIVRTLAYDPEIIFMDEPFVGLDVQTREALEDDILRLWQETKKTIVFVTHDLAEAITLADRVVIMTARPGAVKAEYTVSLPRPRSAAETKFSPQFIKLHKRIWEDLSNEVRNSHGNEGR